VFELSKRQATLEEAFLDATGASEEFRASMGFGSGFGGPTAGPRDYGQQGYGPPPSEPPTPARPDRGDRPEPPENGVDR
jgi:hypothetical protein